MASSHTVIAVTVGGGVELIGTLFCNKVVLGISFTDFWDPLHSVGRVFDFLILEIAKKRPGRYVITMVVQITHFSDISGESEWDLQPGNCSVS
jgi:hypothetical protein